jgi:hypothetical protein
VDSGSRRGGEIVAGTDVVDVTVITLVLAGFGRAPSLLFSIRLPATGIIAAATVATAAMPGIEQPGPGAGSGRGHTRLVVL